MLRLAHKRHPMVQSLAARLQQLVEDHVLPRPCFGEVEDSVTKAMDSEPVKAVLAALA